MFKSKFAFDTVTLGVSTQKRPIEYVYFGPEAHSEDSDPYSRTLDTLFFGVFHGDEGISGELMHRLVDYLKQNGLADPAKAVGIIPVLNPDGLAIDCRTNANDVDLNRNFPTENWVEENKGEIYYSGKAPASEVETRLVVELLENTCPKKIITVHAPYRVVNYDGPAEGLARAMSQHNGYPAVADIGYLTAGSFGTYVGIERGIPTITLELPEDESLEQVWKDNKEALLAAIEF